MRKLFISIISVALLAFSACMFVGCGGLNDDEEVIREALVSELDAIKNLDDATVAELSDGMDVDALAQYGIDGVQFIKDYLAGFDYSIDSITIDGDTAEAIVTLSCKSFTGFESALTDAVAKLSQDSSLATKNQDELNAYLGQVITDCLLNTEVKQTEPITLTYTKNGNTWEPDASASNDIMYAMTAN